MKNHFNLRSNYLNFYLHFCFFIQYQPIKIKYFFEIIYLLAKVFFDFIDDNNICKPSFKPNPLNYQHGQIYLLLINQNHLLWFHYSKYCYYLYYYLTKRSLIFSQFLTFNYEETLKLFEILLMNFNSIKNQFILLFI